MQTNIFCKRDDFGQDKRRAAEPGPGARCQLPRAALVLAGVFAEPGLSFPPSLAKGTAGGSLLRAHRPARGRGSRRPRGSRGRGEAGGPLRIPGAASFLQPGEAPVHPEAGYRLGPRRRLPASSKPGAARLTHQGIEIPAKTRASELCILIEIAGLGTAGGRLYRFDFCCSGEHITTD